jgi:hypothetical protein
MTKKTTIVIAGIVIFAGIFFMFWTAKTAKEKSNSILEEFNRVNKSLDRANDSLNNANDTLLKTTDSLYKRRLLSSTIIPFVHTSERSESGITVTVKTPAVVMQRPDQPLLPCSTALAAFSSK